MKKRLLCLLMAILMIAQLVLPAGAEAFAEEGEQVAQETLEETPEVPEEEPETESTEPSEAPEEEPTEEAAEAPTEAPEEPVEETTEAPTEVPEEELLEEGTVEEIEDAHAEETPDVFGPEYCGDDLTWKLEDGVLTISGEGYMWYYSEEEPAPWYGEKITSLVLEEGVASIGSYAFKDCGLTGELVLPRSLYHIGEGAFQGCTGITTITIYYYSDREDHTRIDSRAFDYPDDHGYVVNFYGGTPEQWKSAAGDSALNSYPVHYRTEDGKERCGDDLTWTLEDGVLTISGSGRMWDSYSYSSWIPAWKYEKIKKLVLNEGITSICDNAFSGFADFQSCLDLEDGNLILPKSLTSVAENAFDGCQSIDHVTLYNNWRTEGYYDEYYGLTLYLPYRSDRAYVVDFYGGDPDTARRVFGDNRYNYVIHYLTEDGKERCGDYLTWTLEDGVLTISGSGRMWDSYGDSSWTPGWKEEKIKKLVLNEGILSICNNAFSSDSDYPSCLDLEDGNLVLPRSLTDVAEDAFNGCQSIERVTLYNNWHTDGYDEYYGLTLCLPNRYDRAYIVDFYGGDPDTAQCVFGDDQSNYVIHYLTEDGRERCGDDLTWTFENGVLTISGTGDMWTLWQPLWNDYQGFKGLVLDDRITSISENAFSRNIEFDGWESCGLKLESGKLVLPKSLRSIGEHAFWNCDSIQTVEVFDALTSIGDYAFFSFSEAGSLKEIIYHGSKEDWAQVSKGYEALSESAQVTCLEDNTGSCGDGLRWRLDSQGILTISGTGAMRDYAASGEKAPWSGQKISKLVFEEGITRIGANAFSGLDYTGSLLLPKTLVSIGDAAFAGCTGLQGVYYRGTQDQWKAVSVQPGNEVLEKVTYLAGERAGLCGDNLTWTLAGDGTLTISGTGAMWDWSEYQECPWVNSNVKNLVLEEGITAIGDYAFYKIKLQGDLVLPKSVQRIGDYAFYENGNLNSIEILGRVDYVGTEAFDCEIRDLYYYGTLSQWKEACAGYISLYNDIHFVTEAGQERCGDDLVVTLDENGVLTITGTGAMWEDRYYKPWKYENVTDIVLDDRITSIASYAFEQIGNTTIRVNGILELPKSLKTIGYYAFNGVEDMFAVQMYDSVMRIGGDAFSRPSGSPEEVHVFYYGTPEQWKQIEKSNQYSSCGLENANMHFKSKAGEHCGDDLVFTLDDDGVLTITGTGAMWEDRYYKPWKYENVTDIVLDDRITSIPSYTFDDSYEGTSIRVNGVLKLPKSLEKIGYSAFSGVKGLTAVEMYGSVTSIGGQAFPSESYWGGTESVADVYYYGTLAQWNQIKMGNQYDGCGLENFHRHFLSEAGEHCGDDLVWTLDEDGTLTISGTGDMWENGSYYMPWRNRKVTKLVLEEGITSIADSAFNKGWGEENSGLSLTDTLVLPKSLETIGSWAFSGCSSIRSIEIGSGLKTIKKRAFDDCIPLTDIYYHGTQAQWDAIKIQSGNTCLTNATLHTQAPIHYVGVPDDVENPNPAGLDLGQTVTLQDLTRAGYMFLGWFDRETEGKQITQVSADSGELTLYARWQANPYTVVFDGNGGEGTMEPLNAVYDTELTLPANVFEKEGNIFDSWNTQSDGQGQMYQPGETVRNLAEEGTVTLYAQWRDNAYRIIYTGVPDDVENPNPKTVPFDTPLTLQNLTRTGYAFAGWFDSETGGKKVTQIAKTNRDNVTLYARWTANSYTLAFNANGGTGKTASKSLKYDEKLDLPESGFAKKGYTFTGWNTQADGQGTGYEAGREISNLTEKNKGTVTLYAQWKANEYIVAFDGNGGQGDVAEVSAVYDTANAKFPENSFTYKGFDFAGWNTMANGKGKTYQPGAKIRNLTDQGSVTVYAQWTPHSFTATFRPGAEDTKGTTKDVTKLLNGKAFASPKCGFTKTGYLFDGWKLSEEDEKKGVESVLANGKITVTGAEEGTVTYIAQWTPITYTVRFNANKGTGKMADQTGFLYDQETALTDNGFVRTGYHFVGWNTKANGTGDPFEANAYVSNLTAANKAVVTLYAQWEGDPYELTFHSNNGEEETIAQTLHFGTAEVLDKNIFTRPGYTFSGWNTLETGKGKKYADGAKVTNLGGGLENTRLYAQWTPNKYTVEFHSNLAKDSVKKQTLTYDAKETALTANSFSWKGHAFQGWALEKEGEIVYQNKALVQNLTTEKVIALYAQWEVNKYTIVFDSNGAEEEEIKQPMTYDVADNLRENTFERPGYDFSGWATTAKGKAVHTDGKIVKNLTEKDDGKIRLYAVWTPHTYTVEFKGGEGTVTGTMKPQKMTYGKAAALTGVGFKRANYTFDGWTFGDEVLENKAKVSNLTTEGTVTLTARWIPTEYTISYQGLTAAERDDLMPTYTVETEDQPGNPIRPGCTFGGWYLDAKCTKSFTDFAGRTGTLKLYPKWEGTAYKYTVKFDPGADDTTGNMEKTTIAAVNGKEYAPKSCSFKRVGYIFYGWRLPNGTVITAKQKFSNLGKSEGAEVTLTAVWKPVTYKVRFQANGGTGKMADQTGLVYDEGMALQANAFTRSGYIFAGWNTKANGMGIGYGDGATVEKLTAANNGTVTLYAQWVKN